MDASVRELNSFLEAQAGAGAGRQHDKKKANVMPTKALSTSPADTDEEDEGIAPQTKRRREGEISVEGGEPVSQPRSSGQQGSHESTGGVDNSRLRSKDCERTSGFTEGMPGSDAGVAAMLRSLQGNTEGQRPAPVPFPHLNPGPAAAAATAAANTGAASEPLEPSNPSTTPLVPLAPTSAFVPALRLGARHPWAAARAHAPPGLDEVEVTCGVLRGTYQVNTQKIRYMNRGYSPTEFERIAGKGATKKWKQSIRVVNRDGSMGQSLGDWLLEMGYEQPRAFMALPGGMAPRPGSDMGAMAVDGAAGGSAVGPEEAVGNAAELLPSEVIGAICKILPAGIQLTVLKGTDGRVSVNTAPLGLDPESTPEEDDSAPSPTPQPTHKPRGKSGGAAAAPAAAAAAAAGMGNAAGSPAPPMQTLSLQTLAPPPPPPLQPVFVSGKGPAAPVGPGAPPSVQPLPLGGGHQGPQLQARPGSNPGPGPALIISGPQPGGPSMVGPPGMNMMQMSAGPQFQAGPPLAFMQPQAQLQPGQPGLQLQPFGSAGPPGGQGPPGPGGFMQGGQGQGGTGGAGGFQPGPSPQGYGGPGQGPPSMQPQQQPQQPIPVQLVDPTGRPVVYRQASQQGPVHFLQHMPLQPGQGPPPPPLHQYHSQPLPLQHPMQGGAPQGQSYSAPHLHPQQMNLAGYPQPYGALQYANGQQGPVLMSLPGGPQGAQEHHQLMYTVPQGGLQYASVGPGPGSGGGPSQGMIHMGPGGGQPLPGTTYMYTPSPGGQ